MATPEKASPVAAGIRRAREAKGWTQDQLAEAAGLTPNAIWLIENGRSHPRRKTIDVIVEALGVTESELVSAPETSDAPAKNPPGLQEMLDKQLADPPPSKDELKELRAIRWRGQPDGVAFLFALQAIRRANR